MTWRVSWNCFVREFKDREGAEVFRRMISCGSTLTECEPIGFTATPPGEKKRLQKVLTQS